MRPSSYADRLTSYDGGPGLGPVSLPSERNHMKILVIDFSDGESLEYPDVTFFNDDDKFIQFTWEDRFFRFNWKYVEGYCEEWTPDE